MKALLHCRLWPYRSQQVAPGIVGLQTNRALRTGQVVRTESRLGRAPLPTRHDSLPPSAWPVAADVLLTLWAKRRQLKLNLCDEHLEEPDNIQARAPPWSGPDPPKPEA